MEATKILETVNRQFAGTIPAEAEAIVNEMIAAKSCGFKLFERLESEFACTYGFFDAVKAAIKEEKSAMYYVPRSAAEARIDRMARATK